MEFLGLLVLGDLKGSIARTIDDFLRGASAGGAL